MSAVEKISASSNAVQYACSAPRLCDVPVKIERIYPDDNGSIRPNEVVQKAIDIGPERMLKVEQNIEEGSQVKTESQDVSEYYGNDDGAVVTAEPVSTAGIAEKLPMDDYIIPDKIETLSDMTSAGVSKHVPKIYNKTKSKLITKDIRTCKMDVKKLKGSIDMNKGNVSDSNRKYVHTAISPEVDYLSVARNGLSESAGNPYVYEICDQRFAVLDSLKADIIKFSKSADIQKRIKAHMTEKPFRCDMCERTFARKSEHKKHLIKHSGEKPYTCDICQKKFSQSSNLSDHIRVHTGEKPFACKLCDRRFNQRSHLYKHSKTHGGPKPHACNFCDKSFAMLEYLQKHIRTHTGEKPHTCDICNKKFSESSALSKHKVTHTDEKRFVCEMCEKRFRQKVDLVRHIRLHTGEKPYACKICDKKFTQKSNLVSHSRVHACETLVETVYNDNSNSN